ncbi:hypothetical protein C8J57DRAFT_1287232 [Mycena rebaudengoi]|nr:hypothetical protein C8J57DRAFT_1287232 [Mycena rebaudengoi]
MFPLQVLFSFPLLVFGLPASSEALPPAKVIFQSPTGQFFENIAVRPSSNLLLTSIASPTLFTLDPTATGPTLDSVFTFPNSTGLGGIVEYRPDVYAVITAKVNVSTARALPGSVAIWSVDLSSMGPVATKIATMPPLNDSVLNGLTKLPGRSDLLLASESVAGSVWEINIHTGASRIAIQDASMTPGAAQGPIILGINGLHVHDNSLFFANSARGTFSRVPLLHGAHVQAAGAVQTVAQIDPVGGPDDFAIDCKGRAWVAVHPAALQLIDLVPGGGQTNVAGNASVFKDPTSVAFGRGDSIQKRTAYVTTGAGQVVAVDTKGV